MSFILFIASLGYYFFFSANQLPSAKAQGTTDPYSISVTREEAEAYYQAISDCTTPSLECLVHNVSRFTAIEWVNDIGGQKGSCLSNEGCNDPINNGNQQLPYNPGAINGLAALIGGMYNHPPASSITYVADVLESSKIIPPAYAQGLGFSAMDPILPLWKTFRNISYMFFIIIFVVTGFLIMFRSKVGQTAITAQQAIPKVIVSLLMVTFSYAIAGFMIDLMYLSMALIMGVFDSVLNTADKNYLGMNIFGVIGELFKNSWNPGVYGDLISGVLDAVSWEFLQGVVSWLGGLSLSIILTIAVLIGAIKLFFELLRAYATIVISIVVAPLTLMMNAIPGNNAFMTWIKTLVGHLLPFPTVLAVLAIFGVFAQNSNGGSGGFMPPFLIGGGQSDAITYVLGLAILLALPEIVKHIREAIAPKNAFAEMILSSAKQNFQAGWTGKTPYGQMPLGLSGRNITKLGYGALGSGIGAGTGALVGGTISSLKGKGFGKGAGTGAIAGGVAPIVTPYAFQTGKRIIKDTYGQATQTLGGQLATDAKVYVRKFGEERGLFKKPKPPEDPNSSASERGATDVSKRTDDVSAGGI